MKKKQKQNGSLRLTVTPYSFSRNLFDAYDDVFSMVNDSDWVCFLDADVAFLETSDFGHLIQGYIDKYPDTGIFTCYASRCHYATQTRKGVSQDQDSIRYYAQKTVDIRAELNLKVKEIDRRIAGHLIVIKKATWMAIREDLKKRTEKKKILGFDTQLSYTVLDFGLKIRLMRSLMVFHYLRLLTGKNVKIK